MVNIQTYSKRITAMQALLPSPEMVAAVSRMFPLAMTTETSAHAAKLRIAENLLPYAYRTARDASASKGRVAYGLPLLGW